MKIKSPIYTTETALLELRRSSDEPLNEYLGINNKTLKLILLDAAKTVVPNLVRSDTNYVIHHLDCDNTNNTLSNISLMSEQDHNDFHSKLRSRTHNPKKLPANEFLIVGGYADKCIKIGSILLGLVSQAGSEDKPNLD